MSVSQNFPAISPSLNLNFARSKKLDPRITFTRSSSATRTNAQGLIETVSTNVPRFEHSYNSSTGSVNSLGLLIEESRTNLITYSEDFSDASWTKQNAGITTNTSATTAPDGTNNAEKLIESLDVSTTYHVINKFGGFSATSGTSYTYSLFVKAAERTKCIIGFDIGSAFSNYQYGLYDLSAGTSSIFLGSPTISITPYPNGWYRCSVTAAATGTATAIYTLQTYTTSNGYVGDGTSGIYIWGAQLETRAFPTSYIPTVASTVTRTGDLAYIDLPSNNWYNYSQGSLVFQHSTVPYATGTSPGYPAIGFAQTNGSSTNSIQYFFDKSYNGSQYLVRDAGVDQANINPNNTATAKVGFAYTTNSFILARNGSQVGIDTSGTVPQSIGTLLLGTNEKNVTNNFNACISNVIYYPRALTSTQLQNLTK